METFYDTHFGRAILTFQVYFYFFLTFAKNRLRPNLCVSETNGSESGYFQILKVALFQRRENINNFYAFSESGALRITRVGCQFLKTFRRHLLS